jgi:hypothetical protein
MEILIFAILAILFAGFLLALSFVAVAAAASTFGDLRNSQSVPATGATTLR